MVETLFIHLFFFKIAGFAKIAQKVVIVCGDEATYMTVYLASL